MKFKVGDIVKATTDKYYLYATKNNHWYGIVDTLENNCFFAYTIYADQEANNRYVGLDYDDFEKASIDEIAMIYYMREHNLHIGERFNLLDCPHKWNPYHINEDLQAVDVEGYILKKAALDARAQRVEKIIEPKIKEMTVAEIEKELGYKVKIVKG